MSAYIPKRSISSSTSSVLSVNKPVFNQSVNNTVHSKYSFLFNAYKYNTVENVTIVFTYKATKRTKENVVRKMTPFEVYQSGPFSRLTCYSVDCGYRTFNIEHLTIIDIEFSPKENKPQPQQQVQPQAPINNTTQSSSLLTLENLKCLREMGFTDMNHCNQALLFAKSLDEAIAMLISYEELKL